MHRESAYENRNRSERERAGLMAKENERKRIQREGARAMRGSENERDSWSKRIQWERGSESYERK